MDKIGILFYEDAGNGLTQEYFANIINNFKNVMEKEGYLISFINVADTSKRLSYAEQCKQEEYKGILIACADFDRPEFKELLATGIKMVCIDERISTDNCITVASNNSDGMEKLVEYIISCGHTKIAFIYGDNCSVTDLRKANFVNTCRKHGIAVPEYYLLPGKYRDMQKSEYLTEYLLQSSDPPTCIIYSDDLAAVAGMNIIRARGLEIPEDISVAGYDGIKIVMRYKPVLTTIKQRSDKMGTTAAECLLDMINNKADKYENTIIIDSDLEKGDTVS